MAIQPRGDEPTNRPGSDRPASQARGEEHGNREPINEKDPASTSMPRGERAFDAPDPASASERAARKPAADVTGDGGTPHHGDDARADDLDAVAGIDASGGKRGKADKTTGEKPDGRLRRDHRDAGSA